MDKSRFSELIRRYRDHELGEEGMKTMNGWYETLSQDEAATPWSDADKERLRARMLEQIDEDAPDKARLSRGLWLGVAASVIFVSLFFVVGRTFFGNTVETISADTAPRSIILPDGTHVRLQAGGTLEYPRSFSDHDRVITLKGDAFFDVVKDPSRPFTITCGALQTQVLGTSFSIDCEPSGDVTVAVVTGRVALSSGGARIVLEPHEQGVFTLADQTLHKIQLDMSAWRSLVSEHYPLVFNNTTLQEVLNTLEVRFGVTFILENPTISNCKFTADVSGQSLEMILDLAGQSIGFEKVVQSNGIVLRGPGCTK